MSNYTVKSTYLPEKYSFPGNILDQFDQSTYQITLYMKPNYRSSDPADWPLTADDVIIAQTGTTGIIIPDLSIDSFFTSSGAVATKFSFRLEQPQSVDLLDRIIKVKEDFKYTNVTETVMHLRIRFLGYQADPEDNAAGGESVKIGNDVHYRISLTKLSLSVNESGSVYEFEALDTAGRAAQETWRFPANGHTTGATITEHLTDLCEWLTKHYDGQGHQFKLDSKFLLGDESSGLIKDEDVYLPAQAEDFFARLNAAEERSTTLGDRTAEIKNTFRLDDDNSTDEYAELQENQQIPFKKGQSYYEYLVTLLSVNDDFYDQLTRLAEIDNPDSELDNKKGSVSWVRMNMSSEVIGLDPKSHTLTKEFTLIPTIYKNVRTDMITDERETTLTPAEGQARFQQIFDDGQIQKTYDYLFTGLNDQIVSLDIKYDPSIIILIPRRLGFQSTEAGGTYAATVNSSLDPENQLQRAQANQNSPDPVRSFSPDLPGEPDPLAAPGLFIDSLQYAGSLREENNMGLATKTDDTYTVPEQETPIKAGTRRHTLFGHLVNQSVNDLFLLQLNMTVRGDPWFLDSGQITPSTREQMSMKLDDNCIFLTIRTPELYDSDLTDEDNNTGYWQYGRTSRMFSGVFRLLKTTSNFSDGKYTVDLEAQQILTANLIDSGDE